MFLMNDVVFAIDPAAMTLPVDAARFRALSLPFVIQLGQELFAEHPRLQHTDPERARRLAFLLASRSPEMNAALFVAPAQDCPSEQVVTRFCTLSVDVMATLSTRQQEGSLNAVAADREVWRRLAA
jgi:hypothetical protein